MLTDERLSELFQEWFQREGGDTYFDCWNACARAVEAEVLQEQEPVAWRKKADGALWSIPQFRQLVSVLHVGFEPLYAAPQPPAPCPKCKDAAPIVRDLMLQVIALKDERDALQAKVAEQSAEIERLNSAYEAIDEQRNRDFETIAQQAERIAELERELTDEALKIKAAIDDSRKTLVDWWTEKFAAQAALIEKLENDRDEAANEMRSAIVAELKRLQKMVGEEDYDYAHAIDTFGLVDGVISARALLIEKFEELLRDYAEKEKRDQWCGPATELLAAIAAQKGGAA